MQNKFKYLMIIFFLILNKKKKKIGIIGLSHNNNIGNNLLKFAISIKLYELGFIPYIVGLFSNKSNNDISFIKNNSNLRIVRNFSEIKRNDYDILIVNSDQTWRKFSNTFYDIAFLLFAKNWKIIKFVYGASLGYSIWKFNKRDENIAKECLKSFTGISVREKNAVYLIQKHLHFKANFVLDPTFLIDEKYYLKFINSYEDKNFSNQSYLFIYLFSQNKKIKNFIEISSKKLNYKIFKVRKSHKNSVNKFLYGIYNCKAVITDSYHGTIFSIIFDKPFVSFFSKEDLNDRFISLKELLHIENRFIEYNKTPDFNLLTTRLKFDKKLLNSLKTESITYLKKNLMISF